MRKAISEVVVVVMLLMISVALVGVAYVFVMGFQEQAKSEVQQTGTEAFKKVGSCLETVSFDEKTNNLYVKNCGKYPVSNITIIVDNVPAYTDASTINPKEIKPVVVAVSSKGSYNVKLVSEYVSSATMRVSVTTLPPKKVFVSSAGYDGNLGGLDGADAKCQSLASAAKLSGTFKAWLSNSTTSAASRLTHATVPYNLVNGTIVANNWDDLTDGYLQNYITVTEKGEENIKSLLWTGTKSDGSSATNTCGDWTKNDGNTKGYAGYTDVGSVTKDVWTGTGDTECNIAAKAKLYCFEQ